MNDLYTIKPLEWTNDVQQRTHRASTAIGVHYSIFEPIDRGRYLTACRDNGHVHWRDNFESLADAKAACEADFREMVQEVLQPVTPAAISVTSSIAEQIERGGIGRVD